MYFGGDSQKCERINGLISLVAPKDRTYCGSNLLSGRVALVVILDSLKLSSTVRTILKELGFSTDVSTIRRLQKLDEKSDDKNLYWRTPEAKRRRVKLKNERLQEEVKKFCIDREKGFDYSSCTNLIDVDQNLSNEDQGDSTKADANGGMQTVDIEAVDKEERLIVTEEIRRNERGNSHEENMTTKLCLSRSDTQS